MFLSKIASLEINWSEICKYETIKQNAESVGVFINVVIHVLPHTKSVNTACNKTLLKMD